MTTFDRREEAFENLFVHDQEMQFKAESLRNKKLAAWAALLMAKAGQDAAAYEQTIVAFAVEHGGDQAMVERVRQDLDNAGVPASEAQIRAQMDRLMAEAMREVRTA